ncbi:MAG TPA: type II toxin-antitoxin system VapC family toxin [Acidimicrobiales bacterium]|nr:type II toxin-antitoxin system VapC family toxin [Acidimicrobiales bacterium]
MTDPVVCDASAIVALLLDSGPDGSWVAGQFDEAALAAPGLMPFEAANIIRRHQLGGQVSADQAIQAHADLVDLPVEYWPYEVVARRAWELRSNLTVYDAAYVAVAERLGCRLVTLDGRIGRAPGVRCEVATP